MSKKAVIFFSVWTAFFSALFNGIYTLTGMSTPWIMFVCLAIFFGLGFGPKQAPSCFASAVTGILWAQVDFLLMTFGSIMLGFGGFGAVLVGTAITMIIHIGYIDKLPISIVPFIFAGVCTSFAAVGGLGDITGMIQLGISYIFGIVLCAICGWGQGFAMGKFPAE